MTAAKAHLEETLATIVGDEHVVTDTDVLASYETDWTRRFHGRARCAVRPATTADVAAVLVTCLESGVRVQIQGGNTGLVGGGVPVDGEVVLSTRRLTTLGPVDPASGQLIVGAGTTLSSIQRHVRPLGWDVGVDFAARDSCTIGGMVATNAGGERVLRYGTTRGQLAGLEAVLADGSVLERLAGLPKDNTGYDLVSLLAGSEGTLGVVTSVRLRLIPLLRARAVALVGIADTDAAIAVLHVLRRMLPTLEAAEIFFANGLDLVRRHTGLPAPLSVGYPAYLLVECADHTDPTTSLADALAESDAVEDAVLGSESADRERLWRYREAHTESINAAGIPLKFDVAVPLSLLPKLVSGLPGRIREASANATTVLFGHLNEGNLHVNVLGVAEHEHALSDAVLRLVAELDGSISAEHGVGRAKVEWLPLSRTPTEVTAMRQIKAALDPRGLLNPGVLLP